jgi:uncharacterized protein (TIGR03118 family)
MLRRACSAVLVFGLLALVAASPAAARVRNAYVITNLVSDQPGMATTTDPALVNPWGLVASATSPWWVADNVPGLSTLYNGAGAKIPLEVSVPGGPTGVVFNTPGTGFVVTDGTNSGPARFIFATMAGEIRGWNPAVNPPPGGGTSTQTEVGADRSDVEAVYTGLAFATPAAGSRLYAADFNNARVDVFDSSFGLLTLPGAFVDPGLPAGYAPFGIQTIGGRILVAYAKVEPGTDEEEAGVGLGFVDAFDTDGAFLGRIASRGQLNAPWGLAMAPNTFGRFKGDLLVGNFGNGQINAYHMGADGQYFHDGRLRMSSGKIIAIDGLWALQFGNNAGAGSADSLFFTAGPEEETEGLFGKIDPAP